ncbi:hypothetical protein [Streptomyces prunicolor]|uniref:hypothetical protein n=1 Tax=Streptomyces prunicolor TaxID=67348 RepID=UPI0003721E64|nr:hypothetical protein [Streptomyces prunicolor]
MTQRPTGLDRLLGYVAGRIPDEDSTEDKPKMPSREEIDDTRNELSNSLLAFTELMSPIFDHADGIRTDLTRRGWSPEAAEQVALMWLISMVNSAFRGLVRT